MVHWASFLLKTNTWFILAGLVRSDQNRQKMYMAGVLEEVRICCTRPSYLCYGTKNEIDLGRTAAVLLHADEGRGRRRQAFMVLSFHSVLGRGTNLANKRSVKKHLLKMKLNFKGHSLCSRMLAAVPPHRYGLGLWFRVYGFGLEFRVIPRELILTYRHSPRNQKIQKA